MCSPSLTRQVCLLSLYRTVGIIKSVSARDRLLETADRLFYEEGIRTTGIDHLVDEAGVAKMTLYNNFGSKDDLVAAYLRERHTGWLRRLGSHLERASSPVEEMLAVFDAYLESASRASYRGCPFVNASAELADRGHAGREVVTENKESVRSLLHDQARRAGLGDPDALADHLFLLLEGGVVTAGIRGSCEPLRWAREAAETLIAAHRK